LQSGATYVVGIPSGVVKATLNGKDFTGFDPAAKAWSFAVAKNPSPKYGEISVASEGPADFRTIQAALDYAADQKKPVPAVITVAAGTYYEALSWSSSVPVTIRGATGKADEVVVKFDNYDTLNSGTDARCLFSVKEASTVTIQDLTIENVHTKAGANAGFSNQAETIYFNNTTGALFAKNVRFISRQDTLNLKGFCRFTDCFITGDVDFIWGSADLCLFENCKIEARLDDRGATQVSYVLQARAIPEKRGFVFYKCAFTAEKGRADDSVFMARTGGNAANGWDSIALIGCTLEAGKFKAALWSDDGGLTVTPAKANAATGWRESDTLDTTGALVDFSKRHPASYMLTAAEADAYRSADVIAAGTPIAK